MYYKVPALDDHVMITYCTPHILHTLRTWACISFLTSTFKLRLIVQSALSPSLNSKFWGYVSKLMQLGEELCTVTITPHLLNQGVSGYIQSKNHRNLLRYGVHMCTYVRRLTLIT